jgi:sarcosine oxidase, subunit beta
MVTAHSESSEIVVIGGGIMGCSVALHLAEAGPDVRLLERDGVFEGTSAAGAGFIGYWATEFPTFGPEEVAVERYGLEFYAQLAAGGHEIYHRSNGVLFIATSESAWEGTRASLRHEAEPDSAELDPQAVEERTGGAVKAEGVFGAVLRPSAAQIFAPKVGPVLAERLVRSGGTLETRRPVTGIEVNEGRVTGVETGTGRIACDTVVLAGGAWSKELLTPLGAFLPTVPQLTSRLITDPIGIPPTMPSLFLSGLAPEPGGTVLWVREHLGGLLWGGAYSIHPRDMLVEGPVPPRFDEIPIDGVLECQELARRAEGCMPALAAATSVRVKHGAPCYTPDLRALLGPVPGVGGLHVMAGDNEAGITHGPGFGKVLADNIATGSSQLADIEAWRVDRFEGEFDSDAEVAAGVKKALHRQHDQHRDVSGAA